MAGSRTKRAVCRLAHKALVARWIVLIGAVTIASSACGDAEFGPGSAVDPAPGKDACALLTAREIAQATGKQVLASQHQEFPSECLWTFASDDDWDPTGPNPTFVGVELSYAARDSFDAYLAEPRQSGEQSITSVSGLGEQAFVVSVRLSRVLWVRRGSMVLVAVVSLSTTSPYPLGIEQAFIKLALPRA